MKGLGLKQHQLLYRMAKENLVIRVISDHYENSISVNLEDEEGDNTYEKVSHAMMNSLCKRGLFNCSGWCPSLQITIDTFKLKKQTIEALGVVK